LKEPVVVAVLAEAVEVQLPAEEVLVQPLRQMVLRVLQILEAVEVPEVLLEVRVLQVVLADLE
jgi:hypothetical protein|tara:strand:- start:21 stop:209 length:189 start_codon:yes stop_codon:yes gene_type:complete